MTDQNNKEAFTFFSRDEFSQWHLQDFTVDGIVYNCAEQFMMAQKARLFGDKETEAKIMASTSPKEQKALGRLVANFDPEIWNANAKAIVFRGNYAKFTQNPDLLAKLAATDGTTLVEASPWDKIWGIGLDADDPRASDRSTWLGTNWLGETITDVREALKQEGKLTC